MSYSDIHLFKFEVPHFLDDTISVQKFKSIQPMTIYRSLKNLTDKGLIHKTNKNKTFHLCDTAHVCSITKAHEHNAVLAVCNDCGIAEELKTDLFSKLIKDLKSKRKFNFNNFYNI